MDFNDGVVDIDQDPSGVDAGDQRGLRGEVAQEPRGHGVGSEGELAEEGSPGRRCIRTVTIASCRRIARSAMLSAPGDHPTDQRPDLAARGGALVGWHAQLLIGERKQAAGLLNAITRTSPAVDIRLGSSNVAAATGRV